MAIENTYLLGKNITLGCGFDLQAKAPLDSRQTVPAFAGLQALIDGNAAYEGMIVYDEETKKTYQAQLVDDVLAFREFGINEAELKDLIASETTAAMEFKGAAATLPENPAKGDMYKVTAEFKVGEEDAKVGDSIVYDGTQWFLIPSGDDIEDTWRPVTGVDNDSTLTFVAGDKLEKTVAADGTITYKHVAIDAPTNMNEEGDEQTRTYITQLITDNHGHIIGFKTATENVTDTDTTYEFAGIPVGEDEVAPSNVYFQVTASDADAADVIYLDAYTRNEADGKFATKEYVGTIPTDEKYANITNVISYINKKAEETLAAAQGGSSETAASVKQQLDNYKSENDTRVQAVEDAIDAINDTENGILKQAKTYAEGLADGKVDKVDGKSLSTNDLTDELKGQYDAAYAHSQVAHAPANAQENVIESVKVNGTALEITGKAVDITVPTGALAGKDEVAKDDLSEALKTEIENKVASVAAGDASVTVGGTATAPTVAAKISAAEGNVLTLAEDGLKVILPESTKVEASETNGNIKVDGQEVTVYTHPESHTASEISDFATEVAKVKVENAAKADEATKATQDGNGKVIADTYAEKAATLAGYGIGDAYTKTEIEALLTWGSF